MQIKFLTFEFTKDNGGIARMMLSIVNALANEKKSEVKVFTSKYNKNFSKKNQFIQVDGISGVGFFLFFLTWVKLLRQKRNEIVLCSRFYPEGLIALLSLKKIIVFTHASELLEHPIKIKEFFLGKIRKFVLSSALQVIANSTYTKLLSETWSSKDNVRCIPLGVNEQKFTSSNSFEGRKRDSFVICSLARIHSFKGFDVVFRAICSLSHEMKKDVQYLIAGKGPDLEIEKKKVQELGLIDIVSWVGFVEENNIADFYSNADIFVLCTRLDKQGRNVEGFGLVFLEAQSCGTPVIGTRSGGIPSAIDHENGGFLIEEDDSEGLTKLIKKLYYDRELLAEQGKKARKRVEEACTWTHYVEKLLEVLERE